MHEVSDLGAYSEDSCDYPDFVVMLRELLSKCTTEYKHNPERNKALNYIFFPILMNVPNFLENVLDGTSCPIVAGGRIDPDDVPDSRRPHRPQLVAQLDRPEPLYERLGR